MLKESIVQNVKLVSDTLYFDKIALHDFDQNTLIKHHDNLHYCVTKLEHKKFSQELKNIFDTCSADKIIISSPISLDLIGEQIKNDFSNYGVWYVLYKDISHENTSLEKIRLEMIPNNIQLTESWGIDDSDVVKFLEKQWYNEYYIKYVQCLPTIIQKKYLELRKNHYKEGKHFVMKSNDKIIGHFVYLNMNDSILEMPVNALHIWVSSECNLSERKILHRLFFILCNQYDQELCDKLFAAILLNNIKSYQYFKNNKFTPHFLCIKKF